MGKRYEFNIEDINSVICASKDLTQYTTTFTRKFDNGKPTEYFIETYSANMQIHPTDDTFTIVCERCGSFRRVSSTNIPCESCTSDYVDLVTEDELIKEVTSIVDEEFENTMVFINGLPIE